MPFEENSFVPAWWLKNAHAQTVWSTLFRKPVRLKQKWERIELPDGDFLDLVWDAENIDEKKPIVLLLHGLGGDIHSPYVTGLMKSLSQGGTRPVLMHFRGCSGTSNRLARSYHSGDTKDLAFVVDYLKTKSDQVSAVGISLGGNVLLKWLGETGAQNPLFKAAAVSVPFELKTVADRFMQGVSRIYQSRLLRVLKKNMVKKFKQVKAPFDLSILKNIDSFWEFDDKITARLHGFKNVKEYYKIASSRQYLKNITVPTLIIHSMDDPFMTIEAVPFPSELSSSTRMILTEKGGHVGFITGNIPGNAEYWLEKKIPEFICT